MLNRTKRNSSFGASLVSYSITLAVIFLVAVAGVANVGEKTTAIMCEKAAGNMNPDVDEAQDLEMKDGKCQKKAACVPCPVCAPC